MSRFDQELLRRLTRLARRMTFATGTAEIIQTGLEATCELVGTERVLLLLKDGAAFRPYRLPEDAEEPIALELVEQSDLQERLGLELGTDFLAVPMISRGEIVGLVASALPERIEAAEVEWVLASLADHLSVAIDLCAIDDEQRKALLGELEKERQLGQSQQFAITTLCHDLKSPVSTILLGVEVLSSGELGDLPAGTRRWLRRMRAAAHKVQELSTSALETARVLVGQVSLERKPVALQPLLRAAVDRVAPQAGQRAMHIEASLEPATVLGDGPRIGQIVDNLLGNAVKYGQEGGRIRIENQIAGDAVCVAVINDGDEIPAEESELIFEPYFRRESHAESHEGSGLGLAVARALARWMSGDVVLAPQSQGVRFELVLPCSDADSAKGRMA